MATTDDSSNDEYEINLIENEEDFRSCAKLIAEVFASSENLSVFRKSTAERLYNVWLLPLLQTIVDQKLSVFARHRPTNEIVAAIIGQDLFTYCERNPYDPSGPPSPSPLRDLLDEMANQFIHHDLDQKLKPNLVLFITAGATLANHAGKGIGARLRIHLCNYARDIKRYEYAFIQTTHPATRHIYIKKMNGKELTVVDPANWVWKKQGDGLSRPAKDYKSEPIVNILVKLE